MSFAAMIFTLGIGLGVSGWIFIDAAAVLAARLPQIAKEFRR